MSHPNPNPNPRPPKENQLPLSQSANPAAGNPTKLPPPTPLRPIGTPHIHLARAFTTPPSSHTAPPPPPTFIRPRAPASRSTTPAPSPQTPGTGLRSSAACTTPFIPPNQPAQRPATMPMPVMHSSSVTAATRPVAPAAYGDVPSSATSCSSSTDNDQFTTPAPVSTVTRPHWSTSGIVSKSDLIVRRSQPPPTPARPMGAFKSLSSAPVQATRSRASTHGNGSVSRMPLSESRLFNARSAFVGSGVQVGLNATPPLFQAPRAPPSTAARASLTSAMSVDPSSSTGSLFASTAVMPQRANMLTRDYFMRAVEYLHSFNANTQSGGASAESIDLALPYDKCAYDGPQYLNEHFRIDGKLGQGSFSTVYNVTRLKDARTFALKSLRNHYRGTMDRVCCLEEVWIWHLLAPHPRLVHLASAWEQAGKLHMCMELCPRGTLAEYLEQRAVRVGRPSAEPEVWGYLADVGQALQWMHARGVAHLDVKPDNVYLTPLGGCKLGDFGLATYVGYDSGNPKPSDDDELRALVQEAGGAWKVHVHGLASVEALKFESRRPPDDRHGDVMYAPAESVDGVFSTKTDVFAYGLMALEMVTDAKMPSDGEGFEQLRSGVFTAFLPMIPTETSRELRGVMSACLHTMPAFRPTIKQIMDLEQMKVAKQRRWADVWSKEDMVTVDEIEEEMDMSLTPTPANPHPDRNPPTWNAAAGESLDAGAQVTAPTTAPASLLHTPRKASSTTPATFTSPTPISTSAFGNSPGNPFAAPSAPPPQTPSRVPGAPSLHRAPKRALSRSSSMSSSGSTPGARPAAHLKPHMLSYDANALATASFGQPKQQFHPLQSFGGGGATHQFASSSQLLAGLTPGPFSSTGEPPLQSTPMATGDGHMWPRMPQHKKPHLFSEPLSISTSFPEGFVESGPQTHASPPEMIIANGGPHSFATTSLTPSSTSSSPVTEYDSPLAARKPIKHQSSMQPPNRISFQRAQTSPVSAPATPLGFGSVLFTQASSASQPSYIPGPEPQDTPMADVDDAGNRSYFDPSADLSSQGGVTSGCGEDDEYDDDEDTPVHMQSPLRGVRARTFSHPATFAPVHFAGLGVEQPPQLDPRGDHVSQGPSPPLTAPDDGLVCDDEDSFMEDAPGSDPGTVDYDRQAAATADQRRRASLSAFHSPRR